MTATPETASDRYKEVTLSARSAGELQQQVARHLAGPWRIAGVFQARAAGTQGIKLTLILEQTEALPFGAMLDRLDATQAVPC